MPTIFFSWQIDRRPNRNFISRCLQIAVDEINRESSLGLDLENVVRVDQDTQGVAGSPAITETILQKVEACDVFVPDVTFVNESSNMRAIPNPNVMIEYGYALKAAGPEKILSVMNTQFGAPEELPFDMRHRRFPVTFQLSSEDSDETRSAVRRSFVRELRRRIEAILRERPAAPALAPDFFERMHSFDSGATFAEINCPLTMVVHGKGEVERRFPEGPKMFLRVMPRHAVVPLTRVEAQEQMLAGELWPLGRAAYSGWSPATNLFGACNVARHPRDEILIGAISQIHLNREIWGVETYMLTRAASRLWIDCDFPVISHVSLRQIFEEALSKYLAVAQQRLGLTPPLVIIAGLANIEGYRIILSEHQFSGPIFEDSISHEFIIEDTTLPVGELLQPFFDAVFDGAGAYEPARTEGR